MQNNKFFSEVIPTTLIIAFVLSALCKSYFTNELLNNISNISMIMFSILSLIYVIFNKFTYKVLSILTIIVLILVFISSQNDNFASLKIYFLPFMYIFVGLIVLNFKLNYKIVFLGFLAISLFFIFHFPTGIGSRLFADSSRNYHSVYMLFMTSILYISYIQNNKKLPITPAFISFIICLWSLGRSGIITSLIILLLVIFYNIFTAKLYNKVFSTVIISISIILILSIIYLFQFNIIDNYLWGFTEKGITDKSRGTIIEEYIYLLGQNFHNIFYGVPIEGNLTFYRYGYNLHNSFLRLHALFGLPGFVIILFAIIRSGYHLLKKNKFLFVVFISILLRISTDQAAFFGLMDIILVYFLFSSNHIPAQKNISHNKITYECS